MTTQKTDKTKSATTVPNVTVAPGKPAANPAANLKVPPLLNANLGKSMPGASVGVAKPKTIPATVEGVAHKLSAVTQPAAPPSPAKPMDPPSPAKPPTPDQPQLAKAANIGAILGGVKSLGSGALQGVKSLGSNALQGGKSLAGRAANTLGSEAGRAALRSNAIGIGADTAAGGITAGTLGESRYGFSPMGALSAGAASAGSRLLGGGRFQPAVSNTLRHSAIGAGAGRAAEALGAPEGTAVAGSLLGGSHGLLKGLAPSYAPKVPGLGRLSPQQQNLAMAGTAAAAPAIQGTGAAVQDGIGAISDAMKTEGLEALQSPEFQETIQNQIQSSVGPVVDSVAKNMGFEGGVNQVKEVVQSAQQLGDFGSILQIADPVFQALGMDVSRMTTSQRILGILGMLGIAGGGIGMMMGQGGIGTAGAVGGLGMLAAPYLMQQFGQQSQAPAQPAVAQQTQNYTGSMVPGAAQQPGGGNFLGGLLGNQNVQNMMNGAQGAFNDGMQSVGNYFKTSSALEKAAGHAYSKNDKLYYFKGRNTPVIAPSAAEAKNRKRRGGNEIVSVSSPSASDRKAMQAGRWVRTRKDGKSPTKSQHGKGRGYGPPRKKKTSS